MKELVKKESNELIPKDIGNMTLNELLTRDDVEVHKKDNVLKMKRKTQTESVMVEVRKYDDSLIVSQSKTPLNKPFNQMGDTIEKMRKEGKTQAAVADHLGTTPSNISKIEKSLRAKR